ncbi:hypothetical protein UFOVP858_17 [uncultured Caudovirales phage]|jgi:hypothetical protein|uniref:Uncharacterized protein n=1 Tax=uncultured Caudovirales phage TaxID=2100421 RepID=A0A6J5P5V5_9CAUD|nr:hypothetical protein UFOVP858_17 [uncultured Caudovirales phage]
MRWLFIWQGEDLSMAYEVYSCATKDEAALRFKADNPDAFAFAVIGGNDFGVEEFHA